MKTAPDDSGDWCRDHQWAQVRIILRSNRLDMDGSISSETEHKDNGSCDSNLHPALANIFNPSLYHRPYLFKFSITKWKTIIKFSQL